MMEREKRTSTADIASGGESEVRESEVRAGEPELDEELHESEVRESEVRAEERELDEELHEGVRDGTEPEERRPLLGDDATSDVGSRWERIQGSFVDEPRRAVEEADALVAELMQQLADSFAKERERLEGQWARGDEVSTEDLRIALQRYRSFFDRLLSA
jgi:hypothetical protein